MDWLSFLLEVLKLTIPALTVFLVSFYMLRQVLENDFQKKNLEYKRQIRNDVNPVKMQAYERMLLFLERINPSSLLVRMTTAQMTAAQLRHELNESINEEFNHNIAQQLYVSPQAWQVIRVVKEQVLHIINESYKHLPEGSSAVDLSKAILENIIKSEEIPTDKGINFLKKEFQLVFNP